MLWEHDNTWKRPYIQEQDPGNGDSLMHYGKKGMHWGVITQEKLLHPVRAGIRRIQEERKEQARINENAYQQGYRRGQQVGGNTLIGSKARRRQQQLQKANEPPKPDMIDKAIQNLADQYGVGQFAPMVSNKLKTLAMEKGIAYLTSEKGLKTVNRISQKATPALGTLLEKGMQAYDLGVPAAKRGLRNAAKTSARGARFMAKVSVKYGKRSYNWLKQGGADQIRTNVVNLEDTVRKYGKLSYNRVRSGAREAVRRPMRVSGAMHRLLHRRSG